MEKFVLAIDQGTTSTRAILFDKFGTPRFKAQREVALIYPKSGWVEEDAIEVYTSVIDVINELLIRSNLTLKNIDSIGITNQRETTVVWNKETGLPVCNAIVWQSRQSQEICDALEDKKDFIKDKTGLVINPYFSASKIRFILDKYNLQKEAEEGKLLFGTIDSWLIYKLTLGKVHATDITNASRTMLFNIFEKKWDDDLLKLFNIPKCMLPSVHECSYHYGDATLMFASTTIPITGVAGDQQASLFGQTCFDKGNIKNTYGTGCFMLMNIGENPTISKSGLLTTIAWSINGTTTYALEGSVFIGGAAIQWLRDEMKLISKASDSEISAQKVDDSNGVYVVPAFVGLGTPYWDDQVRGAVFGLTRATNKYHFVRATLEAIAYQSKDLMETIKKDSNIEINQLNVDGGATANNYLMQFQSDIIELPIELPSCLETTALGAAFFAGLYTGFYKSQEEIKKSRNIEREFKPSMSHKEVEERYKKWKIAVEATRVFR